MWKTTNDLRMPALSSQLQQNAVMRGDLLDSPSRSNFYLMESPTFTNLPVEVRLRIYHFTTPVFFKIRQHAENAAKSGQISTENYQDYLSIVFRPSILLVAKQICAEVKATAETEPVILVTPSAAALFLLPSSLPKSLLPRIQDIIFEDRNFDCLDSFDERTTISWYQELLQPTPGIITVESPLRYNSELGIEQEYDVHFPFDLLPIIAAWLSEQRQGHTTSVTVTSPELRLANPSLIQAHTRTKEMLKELQITLKSVARFEVEELTHNQWTKNFEGRFKAKILWDGNRLRITDLPDLRNKGWWKTWKQSATLSVDEQIKLVLVGNSPTWRSGYSLYEILEP
ncbi:hypothetical protein H2200_002484 [Cladophialophora chaetospira]|uniref:Uncharacterized protein n=1 Tax=Cladophialophora chaetospira TaxID=386627 RepID=A0AA39CNL6_9EURO|nr:hypothetical protein H2200_002484 [Cladophialophora chaetospira]